MSQQQMETFRYIWCTQGSDAAKAYYDDIMGRSSTIAKQTTFQQMNVAETNKEHPILGFVANTGFNFISGANYPWMAAATLSGDNRAYYDAAQGTIWS